MNNKSVKKWAMCYCPSSTMSFLVYINNTRRGDIWRTFLVQYIAVICLQNVFSELPPSIDSLSGHWRLVLGQRHCEEVRERGRLNRWTLQVAILWRWSLESGANSLLSHIHKDNSTAWKEKCTKSFYWDGWLGSAGVPMQMAPTKKCESVWLGKHISASAHSRWITL